MSLTTILFLIAFAVVSIGAVYAPIIGVIGYVMHYQVSPESQWWEAPVSGWGLRYSLLLAAFTVIGTAISFRRLRYGRRLLCRHEWLVVVFLALVWLSMVLGMGPSETRGSVVDRPEVKLTKVMLFALILTHVVTTRRSLGAFYWAAVLGTLYLGYQAYTAPRSWFVTGRLELIGGPDFRDSNGFAGYLAMVLPIIAIQFIRSEWKGKLLCVASGVLAVNALILTQSRGALVALAGGMVVAVAVAPKEFRKAAIAGLIVAALGGLYLSDEAFIRRAYTITPSGEQRDVSAQSRLDVWAASLRLFKDNPLGVGADNFPRAITSYLPQYSAKDAHNTYVLCYSELGIQGLAAYVLILVSAFEILRRSRRGARELPEPARRDLLWLLYGETIALSVLLFRGLTMSRLYTESSWWLLALPVCLSRAVENARADLPTTLEKDAPAAAPADRSPPRRRQRVAPTVGA